jgi:hypothetical protein
MRYYYINELSADQLEAVAQRLRDMELGGPVSDVFFLPLPEELLDTEQAAHAEGCGPHVMALEMDEDCLRLELLVRARGRLRCSCIKLATPEQRAHMMAYLDDMCAQLGVQA